MRGTMVRRAAGVLAASVLALTGVVVGATPAGAIDNVPGSPGSSCPGRQVHGSPFHISTKEGSVDVTVTYSSAHGGTNCVIARKHGHWAGRKTWMDLSIRRTDSNSGRYPFIALDAGAYRSYAGAISIPHTNGHCVSVELMLGNNSGPQVNVADWQHEHFACG